MNIIVILMIITSLIMCLAGYKLNKFLIVISSIIIGIIIGENIAQQINNKQILSLLIIITSAIIFGILSLKLYNLGIFILSFSLTYAFCKEYIDVNNISIIISLIIGLLAIKFTTPALIITTSSIGAILLNESIKQIMNINNVVSAIIIILITIIGIKFQYSDIKKEGE